MSDLLFVAQQGNLTTLQLKFLAAKYSVKSNIQRLLKGPEQHRAPA